MIGLYVMKANNHNFEKYIKGKSPEARFDGTVSLVFCEGTISP
jgi:hypothetical protein